MSQPSLEAALLPTTFVRSARLAEHLGLDLVLATETFQHTGSFKFRAAMSVALSVPHPHVLTASSGNFGHAMARACRLTGKACTVVMPRTSAQVKVQAVRENGATVDLIDVRQVSRAQRVAELARRHPEAYVASAYDDAFVIAGNATLGRELARLSPPPDVVVAPVGGGGLMAGIVRGLAESHSRAAVVGAEPLQANDAARSLRAGELVADPCEQETLADGARTVSLGRLNWEILRRGLEGIVEVPEERIVEAVRLLFAIANLKAEPTGALSMAALLTKPERFRGRRVCCVVSGGNVDPGLFCRLLTGEVPGA